MLTAANGKVDGVAAANDALANAAITVLGDRGLHDIPVTGQDATVEGLQNILAGEQCMTVYKPVQLEAQAAAHLALELREGAQPTEQTTQLFAGDHDVPSVLLTPIACRQGQHRADGDPRRFPYRRRDLHGPLRGPVQGGRAVMSRTRR